MTLSYLIQRLQNGAQKIFVLILLGLWPNGLWAQQPPPVPTQPPSQKPAETQPTETKPAAPQAGLSSWKVVRAKHYPHYKVEVLERWMLGKFPRVDSMKIRIIPRRGGTVTEYSGTWLSPDPKEFAADWKEGVKLDMNGDGLEDLMIRNSTGGAHCCYGYVAFSMSQPLTKIAEIDLQDCGEKIRLYDLDGNGRPEIMTCDARFTYLGSLPYSESPFPPAIYKLGSEGFERADKSFPQVFQADIERQRKTLQQGYRPAAALQIVTDYLLLGQTDRAWQELDKLYQGQDKEKIKLQLMQKMGLLQAPPSEGTTPPQPAPPAPNSGDALP